MPEAWPSHAVYVERFRVGDLLPPVSERHRLKAVFIGESPHRDEVAPKDPELRSPFRGVAGREWWQELIRIARKDIQVRPVPPRPVLEALCAELGIAVMNAVQFPIDPKILMHQGDFASPKMQLGFEKGTGDHGYKKLSEPVRLAIADLARRLTELASSPAQVVCLGNDSRWFVERAVLQLPKGCPLGLRPLITIPHPSSWWRNAAYRSRAVETLKELLGPRSGVA